MHDQPAQSIIYAALAIAITGCGPLIAADGESSSGSSGGDPITTSDFTTAASTTGTSPGTTPSPTTIATSIDSSSGEGSTTGDDGDECGAICCGFLCEPDDGGSSIECDVWAQDCPDGEKCMPWANDGGNFWTATRCSPLAGPADQVGDPCHVEGSQVSGLDSCALGSMCLWVDPITLEGSCVANCEGNEANPSCADPSTTCVIAFEGVLHECLPICDPLVQDCVRGSCFPFGRPEFQGFACGVPVLPSLADSAACDYPWQCAPGSLCVTGDLAPACEDGDCCAPLCDLGVPDACGPERVCTSVLPEGTMPPEVWDVGYCALP